ncbi:MAG: L,D-transpeptidase [Thermodesulfobacteriota bacterium]
MRTLTGKFFKANFFVILMLAVALPAFAYANADEALVPASIINIASGTHVIAVDKDAHTLYLYESMQGPGSTPKLVKSFRILTGKVVGDKVKEGDKKTPEGIYFFTKTIPGSELPGKYGVHAVVTDYPNKVDRLDKKTGSGIWFHGTDDPPRLERPRDSRGCVVALNKDVIEITRYINHNETPIIVFDSIDFILAEDAGAKRSSIIERLKELKIIKWDGSDRDVFTILRHEKYLTVSVKSGDKLKIYYLRKSNNELKLIAEDSLGRTGKPKKQSARK